MYRALIVADSKQQRMFPVVWGLLQAQWLRQLHVLWGPKHDTARQLNLSADKYFCWSNLSANSLATVNMWWNHPGVRISSVSQVWQNSGIILALQQCPLMMHEKFAELTFSISVSLWHSDRCNKSIPIVYCNTSYYVVTWLHCLAEIWCLFNMSFANEIFRYLLSTVYCLLFAVTHAPFHVSSAEAYSWPNARDRRDREVN